MVSEKNVQKLSYEQAMQELQAIVEKMRAGDLTLEESVKAYQRGKALSDRCETLLTEAAQVVQKLEDVELKPVNPSDLKQEELS